MSQAVDNPYGSPVAVSTAPKTTSNIRRMRLKNVDVISSGKILGILGVVGGLIFGLIMLVFGIIGAALGGDAQAAAGGIVGGLMFLVMMPLIYGVMGFLAGMLYAFFYNIAANMIGGIEFEMEL